VNVAHQRAVPYLWKVVFRLSGNPPRQYERQERRPKPLGRRKRRRSCSSRRAEARRVFLRRRGEERRGEQEVESVAGKGVEEEGGFLPSSFEFIPERSWRKLLRVAIFSFGRRTMEQLWRRIKKPPESVSSPHSTESVSSSRSFSEIYTSPPCHFTSALEDGKLGALSLSVRAVCGGAAEVLVAVPPAHFAACSLARSMMTRKGGRAEQSRAEQSDRMGERAHNGRRPPVGAGPLVLAAVGR